MILRRIAIICALLTLGLLPAGVWGLSGEALEQRVREVTDQLRCPTCQAISVKDSEASFSRQITDKVRRMLREGQTEEQIKDFFVSRYGEWILRAPKKEGLGLVLWLLPGIAMIFVGGWIVLRVYRRARSEREREIPEAAAPLSAQDRARIGRDLRRFEEEI